MVGGEGDWSILAHFGTVFKRVGEVESACTAPGTEQCVGLSACLIEHLLLTTAGNFLRFQTSQCVLYKVSQNSIMKPFRGSETKLCLTNVNIKGLGLFYLFLVSSSNFCQNL